MKKKEKTLGFLLYRASWAMSYFLKENFKKENIDLPHSQYIILREIYEKEGLSQREIATILHIDVSAVKRTLDNLEKKGLIVRQPASLCKNSIILTPRALEMKGKIVTTADKTIEYVLTELRISKKRYDEFSSFLLNIHNLTNK